MDKNVKKKIVIIGGGYAGINAAKILNKKLKRHKNVEISLIDRNPYHTLMTELHEVASGRTAPEAVMVSYKKIFDSTRVKIINDNIITIDFEGKKIISQIKEYDYDYLVIGTGAEPDFFNMEGVKKNGLTLWSLEDAIKIREHIQRNFRKASVEPDPFKRGKLLTFAIAGGGFTGVEMAGELLEWKNSLCEKYGISKNEVKVMIIEALGRILSVMPEKIAKKAHDYFVKKGGEILTGYSITDFKDDKVYLKDGNTIATNTLIWTCGVQGCEFGANLNLKKGSCVNRVCSYSVPIGMTKERKMEHAEGGEYINGKLGRIEVNEFMQSVDNEEVYIAGDMLWFNEKGKVLPQIVETALQSSEVAAKNIIAGIEGNEKIKFRSEYHGFMVSIGGKYGVAHVVNIGMSSIFAMATKHLINLHYLFGIAGINICWEYIRHHFLDVRNNRSIIGGHASAKIRIYWVLILRLFVGSLWLIEGVGKVTGGWLDPSHIYIISPSTTTSASVSGDEAKTDDADSTTSASVKEDNGEDQATSDSSSSDSVSNSQTPKPLLAKPLGIYVWMEKNIISKAPFLFQAFVVIAEILIGLALIGGLFTFIASAGSIGICILFIISSMGGKEVLWYIAAAIAFMGGAGRGFGLDYWVIPWIKKLWNGTYLAKKTYLYIDDE
jgi:NADH:ubiquinone reductase (H+-translocating)